MPLPPAAARGCGGSALQPAVPRQVGERELRRPAPFPPRALHGGGGMAAARCPRAAGLWAEPCGRVVGMFFSPLALWVLHRYQKVMRGWQLGKRSPGNEEGLGDC